jgi:hypothetical protein
MAQAKKIRDRTTQAKKTKLIILNFLGLDAIPDELATISGVTEVRLRGNRIRELPRWLAGLAGSLRELDLAQNPISELPPWIGDFVHLTTLRLEDTGIRKLPASVAKLRKLEQVKLPKGVNAAGFPTLAKAVDRLAEYERVWQATLAAEAAEPAPTADRKRRAAKKVKLPWKRLGGIASLNASLSVLVGDADAAGQWDGPRSVLARASALKRLVKTGVLIVDLADDERGIVVDLGAGQGTADVVLSKAGTFAVVEPDWQTLADELAEDQADPAGAAAAIGRAIAGKSTALGRVRVTSGKLVLSWCHADLTEHAGRLRRVRPDRGKVRALEDEALIVGVAKGTYAIERREVAVPGRDEKVVVVVVRNGR